MSPDQFYDLRRVQFDISDEFTASDGVQNQFLLLGVKLPGEPPNHLNQLYLNHPLKFQNQSNTFPVLNCYVSTTFYQVSVRSIEVKHDFRLHQFIPTESEIWKFRRKSASMKPPLILIRLGAKLFIFIVEPAKKVIRKSFLF